MQQVRFNYADINSITLTKKKEVKLLIANIFKQEGKELEYIDYIFCSDEYLLNINRSFLHHDYYTDIITFDLSENKGIIGEVYISAERVKENASILQSTFSQEMLRVIFHGALHLCGYKDKKKSEITLMRGKEDYYLRSFEKRNL